MVMAVVDPVSSALTQRMMMSWNATDMAAIRTIALKRDCSAAQVIRQAVSQWLVQATGDTLDAGTSLGSPAADTQLRNISSMQGDHSSPEIVESETDEELGDVEKVVKHDLKDLRRIEKELWSTYFGEKRKRNGSAVAMVRSLSQLTTLKESKAKVRAGMPKKQVESQPAELEELKARLVRVLMKHPEAMRDVMEELERGGQKQIEARP